MSFSRCRLPIIENGQAYRYARVLKLYFTLVNTSLKTITTESLIHQEKLPIISLIFFIAKLR